MMTTKESKDETITVGSSIFPYDEHSSRECISRTENKVDTETKVSKKAVLFENREKPLGTREKLLLVEAELERRRQRTSTATREKLMRLEAQLAESKLKTSTRTREKVAFAEEELKKLNAATSSKTREKLMQLQEAIKREKDKKLSTKSYEVFRKKQELLSKMLRESSSLDIAFLVDCTGSMLPYIVETKKDIDGIVSSIKENFENKVQVAFVAYRDHDDGEKRIECLQFTEDIAYFQRFVSCINANGGGDAPEDVLGGIEAAVNLNWSSKNRILFHVGDAPHHGQRFHNLPPEADKYYKSEPRVIHIEDLLNKIKQMKISYFFGKINETTDKMINEFKAVGGHEIIQYTDLKSPDLMSLLVVDSVTKTLDATIGKSMHTFKITDTIHGLSAISEVSDAGKTLKDYTISEAGPDEVKMLERNSAHWLECYIPALSSVSEIKNKIGAINHKWTMTTIKIATDPFAQGEQRITYHGEKIYTDDYRKSKESIVLKEFKHIGHGRDRRQDYIEVMETQTIAAYLATEFNKIAPEGSKAIHFLHVSVIQVSRKDGSLQYFNVEVLLDDYKERFKKWNNNCGYVSESYYSATLDAFSHWTYTATDGFLMVVDLQGVDRDDTYILTDPSINCNEPRFGLTNLGEVGMKQFFKSHSCNSVCEAMKLEKNRYMRATTPRRLSKLLTKLIWH